MLVQWFRQQRRWVGVMALSLVLKVIIAGLHVPMALAAADRTNGVGNGAIQVPTFAQFIICTPSGVKTVTLDDNGDPVDEPTPPQALTSCGICSVLHTGLATLAPSVDVQVLARRPSTALNSALDAPCTPTAPRLARGHDPPQV